jgi:hypothetical protein
MLPAYYRRRDGQSIETNPPLVARLDYTTRGRSRDFDVSLRIELQAKKKAGEASLVHFCYTQS